YTIVDRVEDVLPAILNAPEPALGDNIRRM
ncbi:MAG: hypothetical protein RLY86_4318, partial [Pseudomonadota bacterium]